MANLIAPGVPTLKKLASFTRTVAAAGGLCWSHLVLFCTRNSGSDSMPDLGRSPSNGKEDQATRIARLWQYFFADPSQWWDNRLDKVQSGGFHSQIQNTHPSNIQLQRRHDGLTICLNPLGYKQRLAGMAQGTEEEQSFLSASEFSSQAMKIKWLWLEFFSEPLQWCVNRFDKKNSKHPDFKHKSTKETLWINKRFTPSGVQARLVAMAQGRGGEQSIPSTSKTSGEAVRSEQLWQRFFSDPSQWWDTRSNK